MLGRQRGVTLLDLAVLITILGIMSIPIIMNIDNDQKRALVGDTVEKNYRIRKALDDFFYDNSRWPAPADPTLSPADPAYGQEAPGSVPAIAVRDVDTPPDGIQEQVLVGTIPVQTLNLEPGDMLDAMGNKFTYMVVSEFTLPASYNADRALITIRRYVDPNPAINCPPIAPANLVDTVQGAGSYVVFSHGINGRGAYNAEGVIPAGNACPAAATAGEDENCDQDATFIEDHCARNNTAGPNFYDDILTPASYRVLPTNRLWIRNPANLAADTISGLGPQVYGIGGRSTDTRTSLEVYGNVRIENGDVKAERVCASGQTNCFESAIIGGAGINCAPDGAMTGISLGQANCGRSAHPGNTGTCSGTGTFVSGFSSTGEVVCN